MTSKHSPTSDPSIQMLKDFDPLCEPGLISILFLSCGKHKLTKKCLESTLQASRQYSGDIEWVFLEQGCDEENYLLFSSFPAVRKVIIRQSNYGINNGFNQLWSISRGEFGFILESDWYNQLQNFDFLGVSKQILQENNDIDIVQCRSIHDPNENWGIHKTDYNPWSCYAKNMSVEFLSSGYRFQKCTFPNGFNNNPNLIRKSLWRKCGPYPEPPMHADLRYGEIEYQRLVEKTGCSIAHIDKEVYYHAGGAARSIYENM